jgi:hypothetical protein
MLLPIDMLDNYEQRKVANTVVGELVVDTCRVTDSAFPYETGVEHPNYNNGEWVVVEHYNSKVDAQTGHDKWVKIMTTKPLPKALRDVSTSEVANLVDVVGGNKKWRNRPKRKEVK